MGAPLEELSIEGFKSIKELKNFKLSSLNVLVGANGAGKSNFVDFFRLLRAMADEGLRDFISSTYGKADSYLFGGPKITSSINAHLVFGSNAYRFSLRAVPTGELIVANESVLYRGGGGWDLKGIGQVESGLKKWKNTKSNWGNYFGPAHYVSESVSSWIVYHFHDTSITAPARRVQSLRDFRELRPDAGNIAAFLYKLKERDQATYDEIKYHIQLIAPYFDDFILEPDGPEGGEMIRLEWRQKGSSYPMQPYQFSDGTMRFVCLATALLQPSPPATIVIDEPELGLHPFALNVVASLISRVSETTQVIVSTQSAPLLDNFSPENVVIVERKDGASNFRRVEADALSEWLQEYSLGQIWQKNLIEGGPLYEGLPPTSSDKEI